MAASSFLSRRNPFWWTTLELGLWVPTLQRVTCPLIIQIVIYLSFEKDFMFYFMRVSVCLCVCKCTIHVQCLQKPESSRSSGTRAIDTQELPCGCPAQVLYNSIVSAFGHWVIFPASVSSAYSQTTFIWYCDRLTHVSGFLWSFSEAWKKVPQILDNLFRLELVRSTPHLLKGFRRSTLEWGVLGS